MRSEYLSELGMLFINLATVAQIMVFPSMMIGLALQYFFGEVSK